MKGRSYLQQNHSDCPASLNSSKFEQARKYDGGKECVFYVGLDYVDIPELKDYPDPKGYLELLLATFLSEGPVPSKRVYRPDVYDVMAIFDSKRSNDFTKSKVETPPSQDSRPAPRVKPKQASTVPSYTPEPQPAVEEVPAKVEIEALSWNELDEEDWGNDANDPSKRESSRITAIDF